MPKTIALIVAAGRGLRAAGLDRPELARHSEPPSRNDLPKQYALVGDAPVLVHTLRTFLSHDHIDGVRPVILREHTDLYTRALAYLATPLKAKLREPILGADSRQASVRQGLEGIAADEAEFVLIHDAARPFLTGAMISSLLDELMTCRAATLARRLTDTIKRATPGNFVARTIPRDDLWRAETPQGFRYGEIREAHRRAAADATTPFTDDASIAEWAGIPVALVDHQGDNSKITTPEDLIMAAMRLGGGAAATSLPDIRTGQGFDVHRFKDGDHIWLCGIKVPHVRGVEAHSDGDVGLHALTDALLGAIADGDIGVHFKNTDPRWKGASSDLFVKDAVERVLRRGGIIRHVDLTVLCEAPKIARYRDAMRQRLSELLGLAVDRIGLKATTTEGLGFAGRGEGLAAMATATVAFAGH